MLKRKLFLGIALTGLLTLFGSMLVWAQSSETILTVAVQDWQADMLSDRVLQGFYDTHPGVKIVPVILSGDEGYFGIDPSDLDGTLDKAEAYYSKADIVPAQEYNLNPLITRAGFVLDLTPYTRADVNGSVDDFYPVALKTFEWEDGLWALPVSLRLTFITYNPDAFDNAGYPHPDSSWRIQDYLDAGRALTVRDDKGNVTLPGFYGFDERVLLRGIEGVSFYDDSTQPETPLINNPDVVSALEALDAYNKELTGDDPQNMAMQQWDWNKIPMQMGGAWMLDASGDRPSQLPVLFKGDTALVSGEGFAISSGTQSPDLAYDLVTYLAGDVEVMSRFYGDSPARRSLEGQSADGFMVSTSDQFKDILPNALENGIPSSELRYADYFNAARSKMADDESLTLSDALAQAQEQAVSDLEKAATRKDQPIAVSTPVPTPILSADEIAIKFMLQTNYSPIPNRDQWEALAKEFAETDPQVGYVEFVTGSRDPSEAFKTVDCAYTSYNMVPWLDLSLVQPFDPFLSTDSSLDHSDIPDLVWPQVMRDEKTYALPMTITPLMMWYNPKDFESAGLFPPQMGWTVSEFIDALKMLKDTFPDRKPYQSNNYGNAPYILLAAAMGGIAIDYSTYMPTYHLTDPKVIEALRQTLDLARDGYMNYSELDTDQGIVMAGGGGGGSTGPSLYDGPGYVYNWDDVGTEDNPQLPVTYPQGSETIPLSFSVGTAYLTAQTPYADACYRWLSTIEQHLELFNDMPARRSFASNDLLIANQGQTASDFYVGLFDQMDSPNAVIVPAGFGGTNTSPGAYIADIWFNQALDAYVLENKNLDTALADAQKNIDDYRECTKDATPYDYSAQYDQDTWNDYFKQFSDCAISIDPSLAPRFETQNGG